MGLLSRLGRAYQGAARGNNYAQRQFAENDLMAEVRRILGASAGAIEPAAFRGYADPSSVISSRQTNASRVDPTSPAFQEFLASLSPPERAGLLQRLGLSQ